MTEQGLTRIELLKDHNFGSWFVNIRAELRKKKLWEYTQGVYESESTTTVTEEPSKKEQKAFKDWNDKCQEAADIMTPTISPGIQQKLTESEFNDGYLMLTRLRVLLQPTGSSEFMRLSKEYYTLQFKGFKTVSEYLTHIKVLEEKIDATKVVLNEDNRTILCLSMSLPQKYQYLVQIWAVTPGITAEKVRQMVLEASRQHTQALHNSRDSGSALKAGYRDNKARDLCEHCKDPGHPSNLCYTKFPHLAPEWFRLKIKDQAKEKGRRGDRVREVQARLAVSGGDREDDFQDGLRISA